MEVFYNRKGNVDVTLDTIQDKITAYMIGKIEIEELSENEKKIMSRWNAVWTLLNNFHSPSQAVEVHKRKQEEKGDPISIRTAWDDYRNANTLWGSIAHTSYKAKLIVLEEYAMRTFQMAMAAKDIKEMNRAVKNMIEVNRDNKMIDELMASGNEESNQYLLVFKHSETNQETVIDLDSFEVLDDEKQNESLLNAVDNFNMDEVQFRKLLDKDK